MAFLLFPIYFEMINKRRHLPQALTSRVALTHRGSIESGLSVQFAYYDICLSLMTCHLVGSRGQNTIIDPVISDGYAIIERKRERELSTDI